ncbi:MAG: GNAT family N-acetyltransferase [Gemmatimonadales bacterium]
MWRADRTVAGAERPASRDIPALNRLFSDAFTERYRRDGMPGVRVPYLNPMIWEYAIADAGEGAMVWRDGRGDLVAFNMVHRSGREGWMGPLAVRVDRQGSGLGQRIVGDGIAWLQQQGATTIGLETMPRTVENIGFYSRLGFRPGPLTITLQGDAQAALIQGSARLGDLGAGERAAQLEACRRLTDRLAPGVDFTRELEITLALGLGDVTLLEEDGTLRGFALWHTAPLADGRGAEDLRILKLVASDLVTARRLVSAAAAEAAHRRLAHVTLRCQGTAAGLYGTLIEAGWRVQWTDLRMILASHPAPPQDGVVLSNWEI